MVVGTRQWIPFSSCHWFLKPIILLSKIFVGIVGEFGISQKDTHDVLRNNWGKKLKKVLGINPILSKDEIFGKLSDTRQELLEKVGLKFDEFGEVVVGYVDIAKYITLFLSQAGVQSAITAPNHTIIIMDYTDGFPWLK